MEALQKHTKATSSYLNEPLRPLEQAIQELRETMRKNAAEKPDSQ